MERKKIRDPKNRERNNILEIVATVAKEFNTFGLHNTADPGNIIASAMVQKLPSFALGVSVEEVVLRTIELFIKKSLREGE